MERVEEEVGPELVTEGSQPRRSAQASTVSLERGRSASASRTIFCAASRGFRRMSSRISPSASRRRRGGASRRLPGRSALADTMGRASGEPAGTRAAARGRCSRSVERASRPERHGDVAVGPRVQLLDLLDVDDRGAVIRRNFFGSSRDAMRRSFHGALCLAAEVQGARCCGTDRSSRCRRCAGTRAVLLLDQQPLG